MQQKDIERIRSLARMSFAAIAIYALFTIILDGGNVITRTMVYRRWILIAILFVVNTIFWAITKKSSSRSVVLSGLACLVVAQLALAGFSTYWERGMASMSTVLYALPILSMAYWRSRTFTISAALLAAAVYIFAAEKYFYDFFNEGLRVQLYGEMFFFGALFVYCGFVIAHLVRSLKK